MPGGWPGRDTNACRLVSTGVTVPAARRPVRPSRQVARTPCAACGPFCTPARRARVALRNADRPPAAACSATRDQRSVAAAAIVTPSPAHTSRRWAWENRPPQAAGMKGLDMLIRPCYVVSVLIILGLGRSGMARQVGQAVDQAVAQATAPGVIAVAGDRDRMLQERAAGRLSSGGGQPARPGTMVWPAPMTRPITSIAALQLAGQPGLDPGQPAASIPPAVAEPRVPGGSGGGLPEAAPAGAAGDRSPPADTHRRGPSVTPQLRTFSHSELIERTAMSWLSQSRRRC
jgi:hypothetical protein